MQIQANVYNNFMSFPTPPGKRTIIEFVSLSCTTPSVSDDFAQVHMNMYKVSGNSLSPQASPILQMQRGGSAPFGGYVWTGMAKVKVFGDANPNDPTGGNLLSLNIFHTDTSVAVSCSGMLHGHTIAP